jgi:hypothetical protein
MTEIEFLNKIKAGSLNAKVVKVETALGYFELQIRCATEKDYIEAQTKIDLINGDKKIGYHNAAQYENDKKVALLHRVTSIPGQDKPIGSLAQFQEHLSPDIVDYLEEELDLLHDECSPYLKKMTETELKEYYDKIKKNPDSIQTISDMRSLRDLLLFLVSQPSSLLMGK